MRAKVLALLVRNGKLVGVIASTVVLGSAALIFSSAAVPSVAIEAEEGTIGGSASKLTGVANASDNSAVIFATPTTYTRTGTSDFLTGVTATHDQKTNEYIPGIKDSTTLINQHIADFGVVSQDFIDSLVIDISNNTYSLHLDFTELDKRFGPSGTLRDYSEVVLTACCNIEGLGRNLMWDKNGTNGTSDEDVMKTTPRWVNDPGNSNPDTQAYTSQATYDRQIYHRIYADIVKQTVARYPKIRYVQVWNEMKGFNEQGFTPVPGTNHSSGENYKKYTVLYNHIYNAVKSIPGRTVDVGGPYVVMRSYTKRAGWNMPGLGSQTGSWGYVGQEHLEAVKWWYNHKAGAQFITLDIKNHNSCTDPNTTDCDAENSPDPYARMDKYAAVVDWVRQNISPTLPVWWAEWYARKNPIVQNERPDYTGNLDPTSAAYQGTPPERAALMSAGLIKVVKSGVRTALIWGAKGLGADGIYHPMALFNGSMTETQVQRTQKCIKDHFEKGAALYDPRNTNPNVEVLATDGTAGKWLLMVNKTASAQSTTAFGTAFQFSSGYDVKCVQP